MKVSLGEVESTMRKAARGAGWPWGFADELAASARALEASNLPGVALGTALLQLGDLTHCPVRTAARLGDVKVIPTDATLMHCLLLSLPLLGSALGTPSRVLRATWSTGCATVDAGGAVQCKLPASEQPIELTAVRFESTSTHKGATVRHDGHGIAVSETNWQALEQFAIGSYVPASEQSRMGAGPTD
ncbi:MAG: DUF3726 domain-containing protein [Pseudomonadota bacterium]